MNDIQKYGTHLWFLLYLKTISNSVVFLDITSASGEEGKPGICTTLTFWEKKYKRKKIKCNKC
jgi:hypothetical protein